MTGRDGIPASETAELEGLRYQTDQAREELSGAVIVLAEKLASRPSAGQLAWRLTRTGLRRLTVPARHAVPGEPGPGSVRAAVTGYRWAPAVAVLAAAAAAILAVAAARHAQHSRPGAGLASSLVPGRKTAAQRA
jgi:hypothetical protein